MSLKQLVKGILLPKGLRPRTIRGGALKGMRFYLDLQHHAQDWWGLYEVCTQKWLTACTRPGAYCLDIGGADGQIALMMAKFAGPTGRVYSFEPGEKFAQIRKNFELNPAVPLAPLEDFKAYVGTASASAGTDGIPTLAIDQMVADGKIPRVDVVKIDVDGPEVMVLNGMMQTLRKFKPHLFVEIHSRELLTQTEAISKNLGYNMNLEMPHKREMRPIGFNPFYFSDVPKQA